MFKKIKNYDYEVSDIGEIRNIKTGRILKQYSNNKYGRLEIGLCKNGKRKHFYVHRLVLTAFVGSCPKGMEGCHNNGKADDNRVANLRWDTHKNNNQDRELHGHTAKGSKNGLAKLTEEQVKEIRAKYKYKSKDTNTSTLAKEYGVCNQEINNIVTNKYWKHVK